eukprot:4652763-Pleurochrysis_carterae.AAC.2
METKVVNLKDQVHRPTGWFGNKQEAYTLDVSAETQMMRAKSRRSSPTFSCVRASGDEGVRLFILKKALTRRGRGMLAQRRAETPTLLPPAAKRPLRCLRCRRTRSREMRRPNRRFRRRARPQRCARGRAARPAATAHASTRAHRRTRRHIYGWPEREEILNRENRRGLFTSERMSPMTEDTVRER